MDVGFESFDQWQIERNMQEYPEKTLYEMIGSIQTFLMQAVYKWECK